MNMYYILEALAYPAIHLFIMIGSWFMIEKTSVLRNITKIWSQTWIISITGLLLVLIFKNEIFTVLGGGKCIFPFLTRAYWYVSDYIILMLISPAINAAIGKLDDLHLVFTTWICGIVISVFPTFLPIFPWNQNYSNIGLFILMYLITACIKRNKCRISARCGGIFWGISFLILCMSGIVIHNASLKISELSGYEMYFYKYNSIFVILEAVFLFVIFLQLPTINSRHGNIITRISENSLIVYLIHMHPIVKEQYTEWKVLGFIDTNNFEIYTIQIILTCLLIFISGIIVGESVRSIAERLAFGMETFINKKIMLMLKKQRNNIG